MIRKTVLLHVGPHKTGTTALQRFWQENREHLARNGVLYPGPGDAHHRLAYDLLGWPTRRFDRAKILAACAAAPENMVILSSEDFSFFNADQFRRLRDLLHGSDIRVAYFLRRIPDALHSFWIETIKQGRSATFAELADGFPANQISGQAYFDPLMQLRTLEEVFGMDALDVFSYDMIRTSDGDILDAFSDRYFTAKMPAIGLKKKNVTPSLARVELTRQVNKRQAAPNPGGWNSYGFRMLMKRMRERPIPWFNDFKACVAEEAVPYRFEDHALEAISSAVIDLVGDRFVGDRDMAISHYRSRGGRDYLYVPADARLNRTFGDHLDQLATS
ncbi:hypothetical protein [Falsirhodobacter sp. 1013]|uniref:hypothetical protein n=1 Tax=Falsirhodobacter sp. 1013 TaxID=3417566 RepID=UPI003EBD5DFC